MKKSAKTSTKSGVRSPKSKAKSLSRARSYADSGRSAVGLRTSDLGPRTLIIGYGNPIRGDDGFGWHATRCLIPALAGRDVEVLTCHQLTPELAEPLSRSSLAVFIDADCQGAPGQIHQCAVRAPAHEAAAFTHNCTPSSLLANASKLYGKRPRGVAITVSAETFAYGETLSPIVEGALTRVVDLVCGLVPSPTAHTPGIQPGGRIPRCTVPGSLPRYSLHRIV
jgi:hydrogenase maturation protease